MNRPKCPNCGAEMLRDLAPRLIGLPRLAVGQQRLFYRCSFCWARREVVVQTSEQAVP